MLKIKFYILLLCLGLYGLKAGAQTQEFIQACVMSHPMPWSASTRALLSSCLDWQMDNASPVCHGFYSVVEMPALSDPSEVQIRADKVSLYATGKSRLEGHVEIREDQRIINAQTATIYRDAKTGKLTRVELIHGVRYVEPDRFLLANKAVINPEDKSGTIENALYRINVHHASAALPAWGQASWIERFANKDYLLRNATYTTCAPNNNAWQIEAQDIKLDYQKSKGVAHNALLRVHDVPVLYTPYLSFPTSKERKSGFLMPIVGYSTVGGFDYAQPYYWNIAPNYDATFVPHVFTERGVMLGGNFRFLTDNSTGTVGGNWLPNDSAFNQFLLSNRNQYPSLWGLSNDRWSVMMHENTTMLDNLRVNVNYQQVSDDYYLQDFSSNLAVLTENQLLRQGDVTYTTDHWLLSGMLQSYQTLHPINQSVISDIYERLPQIMAIGSYTELPYNARFNILNQMDVYRWPGRTPQPQGPRYHMNPVLSFPWFRPWGFLTPSMEAVENYYDLNHYSAPATITFNRTIPRYSVDSGLIFEREASTFMQTVEPRLYYLYVPYHDQTPIPVFDSAYMIFNYDQLFRNNRFSGYDRIGDANQMAYAITSRWLSAESGQEKANVSIGQIRYFSSRRVPLCFQNNGTCADNPLTLGYLSPTSTYSPIATRASYQMSSAWGVSADYVWDVSTHATNNGDINVHYQPKTNHILNIGYTYLVNGNVTDLISSDVEKGALHQATIAYAWPLTEQWSGFGAYSYNINRKYDMMTFLGVQYDSCCWALRLMGGRTFQSLNPTDLTPQYNNNVYLQILLKGLGSVASSDPVSTIHTYLPGYKDIFH